MLFLYLLALKIISANSCVELISLSSLFYGSPDIHAISGHDKKTINTIASEPFDDDEEHWTAVDESKVLHWSQGQVQLFHLVDH